MGFAQVSARSAVAKKTTVYGSFRGVDFSVDPSLVDDNRSPYAVNLISDTGGMPEKRLGWRSLHNIEKPVNGLFHCELNGNGINIAHGGTKIYKFTDESCEVLKENVTSHKSCAFYGQVESKNYLFILTGGEYLMFDGTEITEVGEKAYIPKVATLQGPDGAAGSTLYPVNLLTKKRQEGFIGTESGTVYKLLSKPIDSIDKIEILNSGTGKKDVLSTDKYTADLTNGKVTFKTAQPATLKNEDNIFITYSVTNDANKDYPNIISQMTNAVTYGESAGGQVFFCGNGKYKNRIYYSFPNNAAYIPDTFFVQAGTEESKCMGFLRMGRYLEVIKEDNGQDGTVYQIYVTTNEESSTVTGGISVQIEQGAVGVGAISSYSFATLLDEPMFLSRRGIFAMCSTNVLAERTMKNRSYYIDAKLTKEDNLETAAAVEWNGYYLLAINEKCYVLDSKNKSYRGNRTYTSDEYIYEAYYWENFPAVCFLEHMGELYFGTTEGKICKLNTDRTKMDRFNDDGKAITAMWSTKNDDDGASYLYKTMQKKGCAVTIKPYTRSSCKIYFSKDGNPDTFIRKGLMDIFTWDDLDFERFSFNTNDSPQDIYLKKKVKKYKRLQLIALNDGLNEGFGILQIAKTFTVGNYAKK